MVLNAQSHLDLKVESLQNKQAKKPFYHTAYTDLVNLLDDKTHKVHFSLDKD